MKNILSCFAMVTIMALSAQSYADKYMDVCNEWCKQVSECRSCSETRGCDKGYHAIAWFGHRGFGMRVIARLPGEELAYACARNAGRFNPTSNKSMCDIFLEVAPTINTFDDEMTDARCDTNKTCGNGFTYKATFFGGVGKNTHACFVVDESGRAQCDHYCRRSDECEKCSPHRNCGAGYTRLALFDGWSSCKPTSRTQGGDSNEAACKEWCSENPGCVECRNKLNCGKGYKRLKSFKEQRPGKNWYACERR